jgi:hypothetical protein
MGLNEDIERLFAMANDMTTNLVAEQLRALARKLDAEEASRSKRDDELAATAEGQAVASGMRSAGLPSDAATVADIVKTIQSPK